MYMYMQDLHCRCDTSAMQPLDFCNGWGRSWNYFRRGIVKWGRANFFSIFCLKSTPFSVSNNGSPLFVKNFKGRGGEKLILGKRGSPPALPTLPPQKGARVGSRRRCAIYLDASNMMSLADGVRALWSYVVELCLLKARN